MKKVDFIVKLIELLSSIMTIADTGTDFYKDIKCVRKEREFDFLDGSSDSEIVTRALDMFKQELSDGQKSMEVISSADKEQLMKEISDNIKLDYNEKTELEREMNILVEHMNEFITERMTADGIVIHKAINDYERQTENLLQIIVDQLEKIAENITTDLTEDNQDNQYINQIKAELENRISQDYMHRYVGKADLILGRDERYLAAMKNLRENLYDVVNREKRIVLLGQAGTGKTTELEKLAQLFCNRGIVPIFIPLNTYDNETIEDLIQQWKREYKIENYILILDGYDEIANIGNFQRKLSSYVRRHPEQKVIISVRNNFYHLSTSGGQSGTLNEFKEYAMFPIFDEDISKYLEKRNIDSDEFWKQVYAKQLIDQVKIPFYFIQLVALFEKKGYLPELKELMPLLIEMSMDRDIVKFDQCRELEMQERKIYEALQKIGITMQLGKVTVIKEKELQQIITEEENKLIRFSGIWRRTIDNSWQFTHNNFREYVTAEYLMKFPIEKIINIVTYEHDRNRIKESWYNVLSFVGILDASGEISTWIFEHDPSILFRYEDDRISTDQKHIFFVDIFEKMNNDYTWVSWRNDEKILAAMAHSECSIKYLLDNLLHPKHERCQNNAVRLLTEQLDYCGQEELVREVFTELVLDGGIKPYIRKELLEALAMTNLYSEQVENEIFDKFKNITELPEETVYGAVLYIDYAQRNNYHVNFLIDCFTKYFGTTDAYFIKHTSELLLGSLNGYDSVNKFLTEILRMEEEKQTNILYELSDCWTSLEQQMENIYERENKNILQSIEGVFDKAAMIYAEIVMQQIIKFWRKENLLEQERNRINNKYTDDIILHRFDSFTDAICNTKQVEREMQIAEQRKKEEMQNFFNALFDKQKFQKLMNEFICIVGKDITYEKIKWHDVYVKTGRMDIRELAHILSKIDWKDNLVENFTENVNWESFSITQIYRRVSRSEVIVSEQQLQFIKSYVEQQMPLIQWEEELKSDRSGGIIYSWRLMYSIYFIVRFRMKVPKDFLYQMILVPKNFVHEIKEKENEGKKYDLERYLLEHLSEHEIVERIKKVLKEKILWGSLALNIIKWCEKYNLKDGRETAERVFSNKESSDYVRCECFGYLQKLGLGNVIAEQYLKQADEDMLNIFAENAVKLNLQMLNERLLEETRQSENKTKYLKTLIMVYPEEALKLYYSIASEKNGIPDYNGEDTASEITEKIAEVSSVEVLDMIVELFKLSCREGFQDAKYWGLSSSVCKALKNIAAQHAQVVLEKLKAISAQSDNINIKGGCNNMILDIEQQYYEQVDVPWTIKQIQESILSAKK